MGACSEELGAVMAMVVMTGGVGVEFVVGVVVW